VAQPERLFKFLRDDGSTVCAPTEFRWPLPAGWKPGAWCPDVVGELEPGSRGYHAVRLDGLCGWALHTARLYVVDLDGDQVDDPYRVVGRRARVIAEVPGWTPELRRRWAVLCATVAVHIAFGDEVPVRAHLLLESTGFGNSEGPLLARWRDDVEALAWLELRAGRRQRHDALMSVVSACGVPPKTLAAASWCWSHTAPKEHQLDVRASLSIHLAKLLGL